MPACVLQGPSGAHELLEVGHVITGAVQGLEEPPPGHPEHLTAGGPLTELEFMLRKELPGWP
ncbi:DUF6059 family protein [Streptomyces sp. NPDC002730]|uniref:DUF6059 family protein n=1 Tax=Streptomyces sp. NPDC002730 TaxID=3364662 RepID=UPI0036742F60